MGAAAAAGGPSCGVGGAAAAPPPPLVFRGPPARLVPRLLPSGLAELSYSPALPQASALSELLAAQPGASQQHGALWLLPPAALLSLQRALRVPPASALACIAFPSAQLAATAEHLAAGLLPDAAVEEALGRVPPALREQMYAFQHEGVRYALRHGGRALLGDEMVRRGRQGHSLLALSQPHAPACRAWARRCRRSR